MAFPLTRHTYRTNKYHHQMSPLRVTLDTTTNVFTSPLPTGHFADHLHLALFADHIHTTPRNLSPTPRAF